jgi:hypothetical protein
MDYLGSHTIDFIEDFQQLSSLLLAFTYEICAAVPQEFAKANLI